VNPMAAELAKVSLWLEALEPGKPLSYLDQNIRVGNSLLGVTPSLLADGLPDAAFTPIESDNRKVASSLKKQNAAERQGQHDLFSPAGIPVTNTALAKRAAAVAQALPESLEDLHIHQQRQAQELAESPQLRTQKLLADAWCAAFVQPKTEETRSIAITQTTLEQFGAGSSTLELAATEDLVADLARQYRFFHWHVEFPHIFRVGNGSDDIDPATGWSGGFSCVIGNPPWERVKLQEQEFFAARSPAIANAHNAAARKKLIAALATSDRFTDRALYASFRAELRKSAGWSHTLRESGRYPLTGRGDINTYAVFAETFHMVVAPRGRCGLVLPTGIATDATTAAFFGDLVRNDNLIHVYSFRNNRGLFKNVGHGDVRFCLLAFTGRGLRLAKARFAFDLGLPDEVNDPSRAYLLDQNNIMLVNPNTGTCPAFKSPRDAEIIIGIYQRVPVLLRRQPELNPWGISFLRMFDMTNDSALFQDEQSLEMDGWTKVGNMFKRDNARALPLYEGKMVFHFDYRFADYHDRQEGRIDSVLPRTSVEDKAKSDFVATPNSWVQEAEVEKRLARFAWNREWLFGWRDIANATSDRTMICAVLPRAGVANNLPLIFSKLEPRCLVTLFACLSSFAFDYITRQKVNSVHLNYFLVEQLPALPPEVYARHAPWSTDTPLDAWMASRSVELFYTARDIASFASDIGDYGAPFRWDEARRFAIRAELDSAFFYLYGINRDDVDYVMDTFPLIKRRDEQRYGSFRTKELILEVYDAMADAVRTGEPYQTILDPPPGQGPRHG